MHVPSIEELRRLSSTEMPFHRAHIYFRRLLDGLFPSFPGGDCYMLSSGLSIRFPGGRIAHCRFHGNEDYHAVYMLPDESYIDMTSRALVYRPGDANYFKYFSPSSDSSDSYFAPRTSLSDKAFMAGRWIGDKYIRINGNYRKVWPDESPGVYLSNGAIVRHLDWLFGIPAPYTEYLISHVPHIFTKHSELH